MYTNYFDYDLVALSACLSFFFFNDTATTEIYTLSLHDALPISSAPTRSSRASPTRFSPWVRRSRDRKSTRLNSSHLGSSYAVFCLKKKKRVRAHLVRPVHHSPVDHRIGDRRDRASGLLLRQFRLFFNDAATTEIYTLSLHDAVAI